MEAPEFFVAVIAIVSIFVGLPWLIMHYVTKWKQAPKITQEDENLLDEMFNLARRLEERVTTVERIVAADNPDFRPQIGDYRSSDPRADYRIEGQSQSQSQRRN